MRARWASRTVSVIAVLAGALAAAAPALAQGLLPPTLQADTAFAPPSGVAKWDFRAGTSQDVAAASAVWGDRIYTVGETNSATRGPDIGVLARRTDGSFDTGFNGDGKLVLPVAATTNRDTATDVVVLPDGRLRILGATDVNASTSSTAVNLDVLVVGLLPDGRLDPAFGGGDGIEIFAPPTRTRDDEGRRIALDAAGRLAVTGRTVNDSARDDTFVALLNPDGSRVESFGVVGVRMFDVARNGLNDRGIDVAFRPGGGLVALVQGEKPPDADGNKWTAFLRALRDAGPEGGSDDPSFSDDGELALPVSTTDVVGGGLAVHAGRIWAAGATRVAADTDAYIARVDPDGANFQLRRFDMRGRAVRADQAVNSQALDVTVTAGPPPALVVVGSMATESGADWAAAAFNGLDRDLAAANFGDLAITLSGQGALVSAAAGGPEWVGVAGTMFEPSTADSSFGAARLLVDSDKQCDLALEIVEPLEAIFEGGATPRLVLRVTNRGTKLCGGIVEAPAPYGLRRAGVTGPVATGLLAPGESATLSDLELVYTGARRATDVVILRVTAAGDDEATNDTRALRVVFRFCDVRLLPEGSARLIPNQGARVFELSVRNLGTAPCRTVRVGVERGGRAAAAGDSYRLDAGRGVTDEVAVSAPRRARVGSVLALVLRARAEGDVENSNDRTTLRPTVIGVGDSNIRSRTRRRFAGSASPGRGPVSRRSRRVARVQIAVRRLDGRGCRWLASSSARFRTFRRSATRPCAPRVWLRARGTRRWSYRLRRSLPRGRYVVYSRAVIGAGFPEARFSRRDRNRLTFRVR